MYKIPAFKYLVFLTFGMLLGVFLKIDETQAIFLLTLSLIYILLSFKLKVIEFVYLLTIVIIGLVLVQKAESDKLKYPHKVIPEFNAGFKGTVKRVISRKEKSHKVLVSGSLHTAALGDNQNIRLLLTIYGRNLPKLNLNEDDRFQSSIYVRTPKNKLFHDSFDERKYAESLGFDFYASVKADKIGIIDRAEGVDALITNARYSLGNKITELFSINNSGIVKAILTGDKSSLSKEIRQDFIDTGTAHVLAVSGLHVGIISSFLVVFLSFIRIRFIKFLLFSILLICFIFITGMQPSTLRAGFMALLIYFAWLNQRNINLLNILSFAVICILLVEPSMIYSIGFQLSVSALLGISVLYERFSKMILRRFNNESRLVKYFASSLSLTLSVSVTVAPLIAYYFNNYSIVSPIANLVIIPIITVSMLFSIIAVGLSYFSFSLAGIYAGASDVLLNLMRTVNSFTASIPYANVKSEFVFIVAIIISLSLVYILFSKSRRMLMFRTVIAASSILLFTLILDIKDEKDIRIVPTEKTVSILLPGKERIFIILDRKPSQRPKLEYDLYMKLKDCTQNSHFLINGNSGIMLTDEIKKSKAIKVRYISLKELQAISKILHLKQNIFQKI